jgi:hypothetical protein
MQTMLLWTLEPQKTLLQIISTKLWPKGLLFSVQNSAFSIFCQGVALLIP